MSIMSPQIGEFLINATHLPDIDAALKKILTEYIELKTADIEGKINKFESKWKMTFEEFQDACKNNKLKVDAYSMRWKRISGNGNNWRASLNIMRILNQNGYKWLSGRAIKGNITS